MVKIDIILKNSKNLNEGLNELKKVVENTKLGQIRHF